MNAPHPRNVPTREDDNAELLALLHQVARADKAAFQRLHLKVSRRVFAFILHRMHDFAKAEEVLSDTLFAVWQCAGTFAGDSRVLTWILGIAANKLKMALRAASSLQRESDDGREVEAREPGEPDAGEIGADPLEQLHEAERGLHVRQCIGRLSPAHRECVMLVFYLEMSLLEVAGLLGVPEGTVKTRLFHARQKVKDCFRRLYLMPSMAGSSS